MTPSPHSLPDLLRVALLGAVFGLFAQACFDPLYESGAPLEDSWVVCCDAQRLTTCLCTDVATCQGSFAVCAGGACTNGAGCGGFGGGAGTGGGASGGGTGGGASGGGTGGGSGSDAGTGFDAGTEDAGTEDAGVGGGAGGGGGGLADAGTGGGAGGGGATGGGGGGLVQFEACCVSGQVTSCECPSSGCTGTPFTPCSSGRCVPVGAQCR